MKRLQPLSRILVLASLGVAQLNATAWAQPVPTPKPTPTPLLSCVRGAMNATSHIFVALRPGVQVAAVGAGFAASCLMLAEAVKGKDFKVSGNIVGQQIDISVVDKSKSCGCPTR